MRTSISISLICSLLLVQACSHRSNSNAILTVQKPTFENFSFEKADSTIISDLYIAVWDWTIQNNQLILLSGQNRDHFLYVLSLPECKLLYKWGEYGRGPNEFISVNWLNTNSENQIGLYDIPQQKMFTYRLMPDTLLLEKTFGFSAWEEGLSRPYTSIQQINNSLYILKADMREYTEIELVNIDTKELMQTFTPVLTRKPNTLYSSYYFYITALNNCIVFAYHYIDRIELFRYDDKYHVEPFLMIGSDEDQTYKEQFDDYNEYYTDVHCNNKYIYALSQQGEKRDNVRNSIIEMYTINGEPVKKFILDKHIHKFSIDDQTGIVYGYDSYKDFDYVYTYKIDID